MQVSKEVFLKLLDEAKAIEKNAKVLSASDEATAEDFKKILSLAVKLFRKVKALGKKK